MQRQWGEWNMRTELLTPGGRLTALPGNNWSEKNVCGVEEWALPPAQDQSLGTHAGKPQLKSRVVPDRKRTEEIVPERRCLDTKRKRLRGRNRATRDKKENCTHHRRQDKLNRPKKEVPQIPECFAHGLWKRVSSHGHNLKPTKINIKHPEEVLGLGILGRNVTTCFSQIKGQNISRQSSSHSNQRRGEMIKIVKESGIGASCYCMDRGPPPPPPQLE